MKFFIIIFVTAIFSIGTIFIIIDTRESSRKIISDTNLIKTETLKIHHEATVKSNGLSKLILEPDNNIEKEKILISSSNIENSAKTIQLLSDNKEFNHFIYKIIEQDEKKLKLIEKEILNVYKISPQKATKLYNEKYLPASKIQIKSIADFENYLLKNKEMLLTQTQQKYTWVLNFSYIFMFIVFSLVFKF